MAKKIQTIDDACPALLTWMIAETVLERKGILPTREIINRIVTRMNYQFNESPHYKNILQRKDGETQLRDFLYMYCECWVDAKFWEKYPMHETEIKYQEDLSWYQENKD